jgi:hypothetical protein
MKIPTLDLILILTPAVILAWSVFIAAEAAQVQIQNQIEDAAQVQIQNLDACIKACHTDTECEACEGDQS